MLSKVVALLISPLGTALVLGAVAVSMAIFCRAGRGRWLALAAGVAAVGWLWLWSTPLASDALCGWIEDQAGPRLIAGVPATRVMVVLGGGVHGPRLPRRPDPDLASFADRVWHAARLFHAGKAERIILSGGMVRTGDGSEAEAMHRFLVDMGVPSAAMRLEDASTNTAENARRTRILLQGEGIDEILLVTSALHMPRARRAFEQAGLRVIAAPTDFEVIDMPFDLLRILPEARALDRSGQAFKEWVGRWVL